MFDSSPAAEEVTEETEGTVQQTTEESNPEASEESPTSETVSETPTPPAGVSTKKTKNKKKIKNKNKKKKKDASVNTTSPNQIIVWGSVEGRPTRCFLDTGSGVNIVSKRLVDQIKTDEEIQQTNRRLRDFSGNPIQTFGVICLPLNLGGTTTQHEFVICNGMDFDILLGHPFFEETGSCINYGNGCLMREGATPVPFKNTPVSIVQTRTIRAGKTQEIPPNSMVYVVGSTKVTEAAVGIIRPNGRRADQGMLVATALAEAQNGSLVLKCVNMGDSPVRIRGGERLGSFEPVPDYSLTRGVNWEDPATSVYGIEQEEEERWTKGELFKRLRVEPPSTESTELNEEEQQELQHILWENRDAFSYDEFDIGCCNMYSASINLKPNAEPRWTNPIPTPYKLRPEMERNINEMMRAGVVEHLEEPSEWNSPIFLVKKKTPGQYRLVADLRNLNQECVGDSYPLPNLNHVLDKIGGDRIFTSLDLSKGFWQVPYTEESKKATAFLYQGKQFCFGRMIMGHKASSAKFTRMMQKLLGTLPIEQVIFFIDDLFLSSSTVSEHLERLNHLLTRLRTAGLKVSPDKTELLRKKVEFVGVSVSEEGIQITEDRVKDLLQLRSPTSKKEVQKTMGAMNFVRKWIPGYSAISRPIHASIRGDGKFHWTEECEQAFLKLKEGIAQRTMLAIPDPEDPYNSFEVTIDASMYGYGATLSQELDTAEGRERRIVAFYSKATPEYKKARGQTRLEFDAMVYALEHWKVYLANTRFVVLTDCKSLLQAKDTLFAKSDATLIRKTRILENYDFEIRHISGESNELVDFLSRFPHMAKPVDVGVQTDAVHQVEEEFPSTEEEPDSTDDFTESSADTQTSSEERSETEDQPTELDSSREQEDGATLVDPNPCEEKDGATQVDPSQCGEEDGTTLVGPSPYEEAAMDGANLLDPTQDKKKRRVTFAETTEEQEITVQLVTEEDDCVCMMSPELPTVAVATVDHSSVRQREEWNKSQEDGTMLVDPEPCEGDGATLVDPVPCEGDGATLVDPDRYEDDSTGHCREHLRTQESTPAWNRRSRLFALVGKGSIHLNSPFLSTLFLHVLFLCVLHIVLAQV